MATVTPTPVPDLGTALPDPSDRTTYGTRGRAVWDWEVNQMVPAINQLAEDTFTNAETAEDSALIAVASANFKGAWSSLTGALNVPAAVWHNSRVWALLVNLANVTTSQPGVSADWVDIGGVKRSGDTMTGPLSVPAGASGAQVPQAQEVVPKVGGAARIPTWTTEGRPSSPSAGDTGFNTTLGTNETYNGSAWVQDRGGNTSALTLSGTSVDVTGIPAWANQIRIPFSGLSTNGSSRYLLRVGTSGGMVTTGYASGAVVSGLGTAGGNDSSGFLFSPSPASVSLSSGEITLSRVSGNIWSFFVVAGFTNAEYAVFGGGSVSLAGVLDRVRLTTLNGTDVYDAGTATVYWRA